MNNETTATGTEAMTDLAVAVTIKHQIGNKALYMIGARNLGGGSDYLQFKIMRNDSGINLVKVTLNAADLYDVTYYKVRGLKFDVVAKDTGIYADMLLASIRTNTGLATSL